MTMTPLQRGVRPGRFILRVSPSLLAVTDGWECSLRPLVSCALVDYSQLLGSPCP